MWKTTLGLILISMAWSLRCNPNVPVATTRATQAKVSAPSEKSEVVLHDAPVVFEPPGLLRFEVH